jgi:NAD(P)H-dependent flavin oxidoreductase YrpB (nitropropane dioxygenase family)
MLSAETFETPITKLLKIKYPILLAGMNVAAGPELAAAVSNAGGFGVIGGVGYTPTFLKAQIVRLKEGLVDKSAPFGIDLLLPKVGEGARKTNYDYTDGHLPELIDIICASGCKLFVSAVGIPSKEVVDKLHAAGILVMNMIGAPKHVEKALDAGCDIICAQGGEGGGHTGDVPTSILIPVVVDMCRNKISSFTGQPVHVIAAGGIFDGRGLAMALCLGAQAAWVGTRFVASVEGGAPMKHKQAVVNAGFHDTLRTVIYTGRPMRVIKTQFNEEYSSKTTEINELLNKGIIPIMDYAQKTEDKIKKGEVPMPSPTEIANLRPLLVGSCAGAINDILPANEIIENMMKGALETIKAIEGRVHRVSKL